MSYGLTKSVDKFFAMVEKEDNCELQEDCIFSVSFINEPKNINLSKTFSGKEKLGYCVMITDKLQKFIGDKAFVVIDVLAPTSNVANSYSELVDMFKLGLSISGNPDENFTKSNLLKFEDLFE